MQETLQHINSVDGVIGTAVFSQKGDLLAHVFPALIDAASLKRAAALTLECSYGLQISQSLDLFDLRYSDGRIVVKTFTGALLFLLCANNINLQVLAITLNLAVKKLQTHLTSPVVAEPDVSVTANDQGDSDGVFRMCISHLANKQASASFDSLGMIAVSQPTYQFITDHFKTPFKKLTLTNPAAATSGSFPVMVMKDMDQQYDGTIVVGPGIEKKLKVTESDKVEVGLG